MMKRTVFTLILALVVCSGRLHGQVEPARTNSSVPAPALALAPYLQALSPESVAVLWQTEQPAYGWVEYGETKALGTKLAAVVNGLRVANVTEHRVVLAGLRPGTCYWYRVCFKPIRLLEAYRVEFEPEQRSETAALQTLPGPQQKVTAVIYNDLHHETATFCQLRQVVGATPFDFSLFNGDCIADPGSEKEVLAALAASTQGAQAGSRPAFFLRGNHETRGAFARDLPRYFAWPANKPYFAFSAGPVRWVVLDYGEDKPDDHAEYSGLVDFDSFRREETAWLKSEIASPAFRKATWRVLVHHIPIYPSQEMGGASDPFRALWCGLLAKARVDLAINGHTHTAAFYPANTIGNPFPIAVGGGPRLNEATVMILEADNHRLKLRMLNADGSEVFPAFEKKRRQAPRGPG
jgi:3',5'-cyclic AMP phosphodiesterase CpdA